MSTPSPAPRVRLDLDVRREQLMRIGLELFSTNSYDAVSIDEIAARAGISKGLLYHYFPEGRPALFSAVTEQLLIELGVRLEHATRVPFSARRRLEHLLATLFGFFNDRPEAYRHLFEDGRASRDALVAGSATAARVQITTELAAVMASTTSGETPSSSAMKKRSRAESSTPAMPITRSFGNPLTSAAR